MLLHWFGIPPSKNQSALQLWSFTGQKVGRYFEAEYRADPVAYLSEHANGARTEKMNMTAQYVFSQKMRLGTVSPQRKGTRVISEITDMDDIRYVYSTFR
jgi:hypothetical protein